MGKRRRGVGPLAGRRRAGQRRLQQRPLGQGWNGPAADPPAPVQQAPRPQLEVAPAPEPAPQAELQWLDEIEAELPARAPDPRDVGPVVPDAPAPLPGPGAVEPVPEVAAAPDAAVPRLQAPPALELPTTPSRAPEAAGADRVPPRPTAPTGTTLNDDGALDPVYAAVNHPELSHAERAQLMLEYRDEQLVGADLLSLYAIRENEEGMPVHGSGDHPGMHVPLYEQLATDPELQALMTHLSGGILDTEAEALDIQQIWSDTQQESARMAGEDTPTAATNERALKGMATLVNYYKYRLQTPSDLGIDVPDELFFQIDDAGYHLSQSRSPTAAVMSQGVQARPGEGDFTADNNFHFFSHAYMTANLAHTHGVGDAGAEAVSGLIGAQYELREGSLGEGSGNSGLKDILMNAEGAAFGTALMRDPDASLPGQWGGPPIEDRSHPNVWDDLPEEVQAIAAEAEDTSAGALAGSVWDGLLAKVGLGSEVEIPERAPDELHPSQRQRR